MKKIIVLLSPFVISLLCAVSYRIIGSEIAADGALIEPFYLIGLSSIFAIIGIFALIISSVLWLYNRKQNNVDSLNY
jgi:cytochrome c biogenesis protein CcdA